MSSDLDVVSKASHIIAVINEHLDQGCEHCRLLLKSGLGDKPNPADADEHPEANLKCSKIV